MFVVLCILQTFSCSISSSWVTFLFMLNKTNHEKLTSEVLDSSDSSLSQAGRRETPLKSFCIRKNCKKLHEEQQRRIRSLTAKGMNAKQTKMAKIHHQQEICQNVDGLIIKELTER